MSTVRFIFRPLDHASWQDDGREVYKSCPFTATYERTLHELEAELRRIGVREAVIEADCGEYAVRMDGQLRADARMNGPRVRLSFTHPAVGPLQYPCDTFGNWKDNMRAIVKTLEAQRAMDRYGATRRNQQYSGWKQLTGRTMELGTAPAAEALPLQEAVRVLATAAGDKPDAPTLERIARTFGVYRDTYRRAVKRVHPDVGGSPEQFQKVIAAKLSLDRHHGVEA